MPRTLHRSLLTAVALFGFLAVGPSLPLQGAIISFNTTTPVPSTLTDWASSLSFPQFNPALGTLVSVELDLSGSFQTTITVTNDSDSASSGTAQTEVQFTVQDVGSNLVVPSPDLVGPTFPYSLGAGDMTSSGLLTKMGSDDEVYTAAPVLAEFTGGGAIVLPASTFTQTLLANTGGNTAADQVTSAALTGTVDYDYIPVPEPATLSLLGIGLLGLAGATWARRRGAA